MSALISLVKNAIWIDLSDKHKQLREELEAFVINHSIKKEPSEIWMLKGAFGMGKTNALHYLFHYGWCKARVPVLYVSLEKLYPKLEAYANTFTCKKISNNELGKFLDEKVQNVLSTLIEGIPNEDSKLFFFDWSESDVESFTSEFKKLKLEKYINNSFEQEEFDQFSPDVIRKSFNNDYRPILLIDEFETKFLKLKSLLEESGGGELRELFDDVVEKRVSFNLIIGNGPASGYELKNEKITKGSDDAESSRIIPKQIPFPLPERTKEFLGTTNKGLLNFAWWASRCRARHFLRLKEAVGALDQLISKSSYAEFLSDFPFFIEAIESSEGGSSPITYVKTEYFNDFSEELKDKYLPKLITEIKPQKISFEKYRIPITKSKKFLFCSPSTINVSEKLMTALSEDINNRMLKVLKDQNKFLELDYDLTIRKYFDFFLKSVADEDGNIAFGMTDDISVDRSFCDLFLLPLIHMSYDFIAQYEEESVARNKQAAEFLVQLLMEIKNKAEQKDVRSLFPKTFSLFKKNDYLDDEGYIQLSLGAIRESFEQPIGEPKLNYKNKNLSSLVDTIVINIDIPIFTHIVSEVELYFIPDLPEHLLKDYLKIIKKFSLENLLKRSLDDGKLTINLVYFSDNNLIKDFQNSVLFENGDNSKPHPAFVLKKFNIQLISSFGLNFPNHTTDFLDSVLKIGLVGFHNGDFSYLKTFLKDGCLEIYSIVNAIKQPDWTERKEARRTIEHFEKLILKNNKSELKIISEQASSIYESKLEEIVPQKKDFSRVLSKYSINDELHKDSTFGSFTIKVINLFLLENKSIPEGFLDLLKYADDNKLGAKKNEKDKKLSFWEFKKFIQTNAILLKDHFENFSNEDSTIQSLKNLITILLKKPQPEEISVYINYLNYTEDHFIESYHKKLGDYTALTLSEAIYNYCFTTKIDLNKTKLDLIEKIKAFKIDITRIRGEIAQTNDKLKDLLKLEDCPFFYEAKLGEIVSKVATRAQKLLEQEITVSLGITITEIVGYFDGIITEAKQFFNQLTQLYNAIQGKSTIINSLQEEVNAIYSDSFVANILNNVKGITKQDGDYYWTSRILPTIKAIPKYYTIFKNKDEYLPSENKTIDKNDIGTFINDLNNKFNDKKTDLDKLKAELDSQVIEIKRLVNIENQLKELLTVSE